MVKKGQEVREKAWIISEVMSDHRLLTQERDEARDTKRKFLEIGFGVYIGQGSFDDYRPNQNYYRRSSCQTSSSNQNSKSNYQTPKYNFQKLCLILN